MNTTPIRRREAQEIVAVECYNRISKFYENEAGNIVKQIQDKFLNRKVRRVNNSPTKELSDFLKSLDVPNMKWISADVEFYSMRVGITFEVVRSFNLVEDVWDHNEKKHNKREFVADLNHRIEVSLYIGKMQGQELVEAGSPHWSCRDEMTVELMRKLIDEHRACQDRCYAIAHQLTGIHKFN